MVYYSTSQLSLWISEVPCKVVNAISFNGLWRGITPNASYLSTSQQEKYDSSCNANDIDERDFIQRKVMECNI